VVNPLAQPSQSAPYFDELEGYNSPGIRHFQTMMFQLTGRRFSTQPLQIAVYLLWDTPRGSWAFVKNDCVVSIESARYQDFADLTTTQVLFGDQTIFGANHSTMGKSSIATTVINQAIRIAQPMQ
jgi:hypothetical protein